MTLWKITAKGNWNWDKGKELVKGMFIEISTTSPTSPLCQAKYKETIANAFNMNYSTKFEKTRMNSSYLTAEKIG